MSKNPIYSAVLVDPNTMRSINGLGASKGRSFNPVWNGAGTYSFNLPIWSKAASAIHRRRTGVLLSRNDVPIWSGGVTSINRAAKAGLVSVVATGFLEEFDHRFVRQDEEEALTFPDPGVAGGEIIMALVDAANAQRDTNGVVRSLRITSGQALDTQVRVNSYHEGDNYGAKLKEMIDVEDGCDIYVNPKTLEISTRAPDAFLTRSEVRFGWGTKPNNLDDVEEVDDGTAVANRISVVGANDVVYSTDDSVAIDDAGVMLEEWLSIGDVVDDTIVGAYGEAELVYRRYGKTTYKLTPKQFGDIPRPYDDFNWGDVGFLSVDRDSFQLDGQAVRLFSSSITIDDAGNEIIGDLQVSLA